MPNHLWNQSWPDQNSERRYPLDNSASGVDISGSFELPDDFLLALRLPVHSGLDTDATKFFIQAVSNSANGYSVVVGYQPDVGEAIEVAIALINKATHEFGMSYALGGRDPFADSMGYVQIGDLANIDQQPAGYFTFAFEETRLESDCIDPMIRGVSGIRVRNGNDVSALLTGIVEFVADENMQITPILEVDEEPRLLFSAIEGEGLTEECVCDENAAGEPIRTINSIRPDSNGNITITGDDCVEIDSIQNGVRIRDTCSAPCCGCEELEAITRDLEKFGDKATTLESLANRLHTSVTGMDQTVLGSKLSDRGCLS